ncbi:MAG: prolipoprotein diacylglyceryl transferase [Candidatus Hydrogenedentes bacterium]|nr:prolipoprotein diacylglyceryl transferase [Candidatus Hydrogenedentota bacterium]
MSTVVWTRVLRRDAAAGDRRLELIYIAALCGAFVGAKAVYFFAEGWRVFFDPSVTPEQLWLGLLTGKTITGALLGGYISVEAAKKMLGYAKATGDFFAIVAPFGLMLGRIGCYIQGCCLGVEMDRHWYTLSDAHGIDRWPAVPIEFTFNLAMFVVALTLYRRRAFNGQLFHIYLIAYGAFRFAHEFARDIPPLIGPITGYQVASLAILVLGVVRYRQRAALARQ